jgi:hypothetical protein
MADTDQIKPLIPESSTSESTTVEVVLNDLRDKTLDIPDYQRDSDQWEEPTKSLFVESVINNLSIPAFFFEVVLQEGVEKNYVIDGQQRLTTLEQFYKNKFRMVDSDDAPYLSPHSVHYAGKTFDELPLAYQQAFKKYRLTVIKLRNMGDMRLEVFRRINQGGTPLSGQDIRLAYYGNGSPSLALIRLAGVYDPEKPGAKRFLDHAQKDFGMDYPWKNKVARQCWEDWWADKEIARGQTSSETFLWAVISAQVEKLDAILQNSSVLQVLNCRFNRAVDEALDACCAQLRYQDRNSEIPPALMPYSEMKDRFFPMFEEWIGYFLGQKGPNLPVTKHRSLSAVIGAAYALSLTPSSLNEQQWTDLVEFVRRPQELALRLGIMYPQSKGKWDGVKGYKAQLNAMRQTVSKIIS